MRRVPVIPAAFAPTSYADRVATISADLDNKMQAAGFPWSASTRASFPWILARVIALAVGTIDRFALYAASGILPNTARDLEQLQDLADVLGLTYRAGTHAAGTAKVQNSSSADITLRAGTRFKDPGTLLVYVSTTDTVIPAGSIADVAILGEFIGSEYLTGISLAWIENPPAGILPSVVYNAPAGGQDEEGVESFRGRILDHYRERPEGGAVADWKLWTKEYLQQPIDNVWIYSPGDPCPTAVDASGYIPTATVGVCYSLSGSGAAMIPDAGEVADVTAHLLTHDDRPVTSIPVAFAPVANAVPISLTCYAASGATTGAEITALESAIATALDDLIDTELADRAVPGATSGVVIRNCLIHAALSRIGGLRYHEITSLDGGAGSADVSTTNSWELTYFVPSFTWSA